eukprot:jgi/Mesen1/10236/ME000774S09583
MRDYEHFGGAMADLRRFFSREKLQPAQPSRLPAGDSPKACETAPPAQAPAVRKRKVQQDLKAMLESQKPGSPRRGGSSAAPGQEHGTLFAPGAFGPPPASSVGATCPGAAYQQRMLFSSGAQPCNGYSSGGGGGSSGGGNGGGRGGGWQGGQPAMPLSTHMPSNAHSFTEPALPSMRGWPDAAARPPPPPLGGAKIHSLPPGSSTPGGIGPSVSLHGPYTHLAAGGARPSAVAPTTHGNSTSASAPSDQAWLQAAGWNEEDLAAACCASQGDGAFSMPSSIVMPLDGRESSDHSTLIAPPHPAHPFPNPATPLASASTAPPSLLHPLSDTGPPASAGGFWNKPLPYQGAQGEHQGQEAATNPFARAFPLGSAVKCQVDAPARGTAGMASPHRSVHPGAPSAAHPWQQQTSSTHGFAPARGYHASLASAAPPPPSPPLPQGHHGVRMDLTCTTPSYTCRQQQQPGRDYGAVGVGGNGSTAAGWENGAYEPAGMDVHRPPGGSDTGHLAMSNQVPSSHRSWAAGSVSGSARGVTAADGWGAPNGSSDGSGGGGSSTLGRAEDASSLHAAESHTGSHFGSYACHTGSHAAAHREVHEASHAGSPRSHGCLLGPQLERAGGKETLPLPEAARCGPSAHVQTLPAVERVPGAPAGSHGWLRASGGESGGREPQSETDRPAQPAHTLQQQPAAQMVPDVAGGSRRPLWAQDAHMGEVVRTLGYAQAGTVHGGKEGSIGPLAHSGGSLATSLVTYAHPGEGLEGSVAPKRPRRARQEGLDACQDAPSPAHLGAVTRQSTPLPAGTPRMVAPLSASLECRGCGRSVMSCLAEVGVAVVVAWETTLVGKPDLAELLLSCARTREEENARELLLLERRDSKKEKDWLLDLDDDDDDAAVAQAMQERGAEGVGNRTCELAGTETHAREKSGGGGEEAAAVEVIVCVVAAAAAAAAGADSAAMTGAGANAGAAAAAAAVPGANAAALTRLAWDVAARWYSGDGCVYAPLACGGCVLAGQARAGGERRQRVTGVYVVATRSENDRLRDKVLLFKEALRVRAGAGAGTSHAEQGNTHRLPDAHSLAEEHAGPKETVTVRRKGKGERIRAPNGDAPGNGTGSIRQGLESGEGLFKRQKSKAGMP